VITINRDVFSRWAVKPRNSLSLTERTRLLISYWTESACGLSSFRFLSRQRFSRHRILVLPLMDAAALTVTWCLSFSRPPLALILRPRDGIWKVLQILSRLRLFPSLPLSHRTLPPLMLTLKRHFHPLLLRPSLLTSPSPRLGVPPWALVSQRTPHR
jgi:hypothetical protein